MSRISSTLFVSLLLVGCASKTIQIVDDKGKPVVGALVISEQLPYILQSWILGVYITDEKGEAVVVHNQGHIFRPGYFPVIEASELSDEILWQPPTHFSKRTAIFPIQADEKVAITSSIYHTEKPIADGIFLVPVGVCSSKEVSYNVKNSRLKVSSSESDIILSERFYFVGADGQKKVSKSERENSISFYCSEGGSLYKVGVSVSAKVWRQGVPDHKLTIFSAKVSSTSTYLQPEVKCAGPENVARSTYGKNRDEKAILYLSSNVENNLSLLKSNIPCSNEYTDQIFDYLERILENG